MSTKSAPAPTPIAGTGEEEAMTAKYHINPETGNPGRCTAKKQCRFGGEAAHYSSEKEARDAYEVTQSALTSFQKEFPEMSDKDLDRLQHMSKISSIPVGELAEADGVNARWAERKVTELQERRVKAAQEARERADANPNSMGDEIEAQELEKAAGLTVPRDFLPSVLRR